MKYYLGIHIIHDPTVVLIDNTGKVIVAIAEERLTRIKSFSGFPYRALDEVLRISKVSKEEIKVVSLSTENIFHPNNKELEDYYLTDDLEYKKSKDIFNNINVGYEYRQIKTLILQNLGINKEVTDKEYKEVSKDYTRKVVRKKLDELGFAHARLDIVEHHRTHASSAFYSSGVMDALIITIDGAGDGLCATASIIDDNKVKRVSQASSDCSPGRFYSEITRFLGFKRNRHEGKITGLAAYGDSEKLYAPLKKFLKFNSSNEKFEYEIKKDSSFIRKLKTIIRIIRNENFAHDYIDSFHEFLRKSYNPVADMKNLAAATQRVAEEVAVEYVSHFRKKYPNKNILLAGGLFANVRINQKIAELDGVEFLYIHQSMGDGGCALGAAYTSLFEIDNTNYNGDTYNTVYFGNEYSDSEIEEYLVKSSLKYKKLENIEKEVARLLHEGKVIGRFNGKMEYGPRALGNRSLIAKPTDKSINAWLNKKLKRTEFMPFAPSVLEEKANDLFVNYDKSSCIKASYFMTITYDVKPEWQEKIQATTHIDGTARPQVVRLSDNPSYYKIIDEYYKLSGIPAIVNTSFNMHEEPIVATPNDAIRAFEQGAMDYLAIGNYICSINQLEVDV